MALRPKFTDRGDWAAVVAAHGRRVAGPPPPVRTPVSEKLDRRAAQHLHPGPFERASGWESDQQREARQRRQRVNAKLEALGVRKPLGW